MHSVIGFPLDSKNKGPEKEPLNIRWRFNAFTGQCFDFRAMVMDVGLGDRLVL